MWFTTRGRYLPKVVQTITGAEYILTDKGSFVNNGQTQNRNPTGASPEVSDLGEGSHCPPDILRLIKVYQKRTEKERGKRKGSGCRLLYVVSGDRKMKKDEVVKPSRPEKTDENGSRSSSIISIASLARAVNHTDILKYLPDVLFTPGLA